VTSAQPAAATTTTTTTSPTTTTTAPGNGQGHGTDQSDLASQSGRGPDGGGAPGQLRRPTSTAG
jgi:hypothetical protein